tara:strand:+ start:2563 stop:3852 length:1290 start_codon:yes stop_codon:yes gene_type:complete
MNWKAKLKGYNWIGISVFLVLVVYLVFKAIDSNVGNDINVYLFAAESYINGENIYTNNPYNFYLYSPLFTLLLAPLTLLPWELSRTLWLFINIACLWRIFVIIRAYCQDHIALNKRNYRVWVGVLVILSLGFVNHNVNLGQITILILWLTLEAIVKSNSGQWAKAGLLLALGINIKIIPIIVIGYWFLQGKFKAIAATFIILGISFIVPALYSGWERNAELHQTWAETINPDREKYAFENNNGCHSLNAVLPAFFYTFPEGDSPTLGNLNRKIVSMDYDTLKNILQFLRIFLLLSVAVIVFYKAAHRRNTYLYAWWEMSYLLLVSLLVLPHQMKYSMLYFVPIAAYVVYYFLLLIQRKTNLSNGHKMVGTISAILIFVLSIMGRDIIGDDIVNFLDFYHFMGISNLIFVGILYYCTPYRLNQVLSGKSH